MKIRLPVFYGKQPKISPHILDQKYGQVAQNVNIESGNLAPWQGLDAAASLTTTYSASSTYALGDRVVYNSILWECTTAITSAEAWTEAHWTSLTPVTLWEYEENGNHNWLVSDQTLKISKTALSNDTYERVYFTGESQPRFFANNNISSTFDPFQDYIKLGVPAGASSSMAFTSGSTGGTNYRAYIYTYINEYGEEGPPAENAAGDIDILETSAYLSGDIVLEGFSSPAAGHGIIDNPSPRLGKIRLYRTNSGTAATARFQFVKDTDISSATNFTTLTITDDVADADLGETIPSITWDPPDSSLDGLVSLSNGVMAGFVGNTVYFSESYMPHAWPYSVSFDEEIVGLGAFGTTVVVLTEGFPYTVNVSDPSILGKSKITSFHPCISAAAIVNAENSCLYPSSEGLCRISQDGLQVVTQNLLTHLNWDDYSPSTMQGAWYGQKYFGFYTDSGDRKGMILDFKESSFTDLVSNRNFYCGYMSRAYGKLYFLMDDAASVDEDNPAAVLPKKIYLWEGDSTNFMYYTWKSKEFIMPSAINLSCARVLLNTTTYADVLTAIQDDSYLSGLNTSLFASGDLEGAFGSAPLNNTRINGDVLYDLSSVSMSGDVTFHLYVDGEIKFSKVINTDKPFKLPSGYKGRRVEVGIEGYVPIYEVRLAQSMRELQSE